jgi:hypothetical protein
VTALRFYLVWTAALAFCAVVWAVIAYVAVNYGGGL